jgi:hypothetical protein
MDDDMKIKWGEIMGQNWLRYLGKEWRWRPDNYFEVRVPVSYFSGLLKTMRLENARDAVTPCDLSEKPDPDSPPLECKDHALFRHCVGKLMYATQVRPDIAFAVKELARKVSQPTRQDVTAMQHLLRYVKGTQDWVLRLGGVESTDEKEIVVVSDASWADGPSRRSTSGGIVVYLGVILLTYSRTQPVVALSTCEAELLALSSGTQEGLFVKHMLAEAGIDAQLRVRTDSSAAKAVCQRRGVGRMKHLEVRHLWLQEAFRDNVYTLDTVKSEENIADSMTKRFAGARHRYLSELLGLHNTCGSG